MARKTATSQKTKIPARQDAKRETVINKPQEYKSGISDYLKFGESYTSLVLGIIVVIIATVLLLSFVHGKNSNKINKPEAFLSSEQLGKNPQKIAQVKQKTMIQQSAAVQLKVMQAIKPKVTKAIQLNAQLKPKTKELIINKAENEAKDKTYT